MDRMASEKSFDFWRSIRLSIVFSNIMWTIKDATETTKAVTINIGVFINTVIDFIIIAFAIFMVIKAMNRLKKKEEEKPAPPPAPSKEEVLLTEIRDLLKK